MLCVQSPKQKHGLSELTAVTEPPHSEPKATSLLSYHSGLDKLQVQQPHLILSLAQLVPFSA